MYLRGLIGYGALLVQEPFGAIRQKRLLTVDSLQ